MKRIIIAHITVVMLLLFVSVAYADDGAMSLTVTTDKTTVKTGEEVTLTVNIHNASDIEKMQFTFNYDKDKLEYKNKIYKNVLKSASLKQVKPIENQGKLGFVASFSEPVSVDSGEVCSFVFTVKDDAAPGNIDYSITKMIIGSGNETAAERDYFDSENSAAVEIEASETGIAVDAVVNLIDTIGEVTLESGEKIATAETAYAALTDDQKVLVSNYEILEAAREKYNKLVADKEAVCLVSSAVIGKENITVGVEIQNAEPKALLILAFYDKDCFIGIKTVNLSGFFGAFSIIVDIPEYYNRLVSAKVFLIDDYSSLRALGNVIEIKP